ITIGNGLYRWLIPDAAFHSAGASAGVTSVPSRWLSAAAVATHASSSASPDWPGPDCSPLPGSSPARDSVDLRDSSGTVPACLRRGRPLPRPRLDLGPSSVLHCSVLHCSVLGRSVLRSPVVRSSVLRCPRTGLRGLGLGGLDQLRALLQQRGQLLEGVHQLR